MANEIVALSMSNITLSLSFLDSRTDRVESHLDTPPCSRSALWQRPWLRANNLSLAICPEIRNHADDVVQARVCALVDEQCAQCAERVDNQTGLNGAVQTGTGEQWQWPFPGERDDAEEQVDDLQNWEGFHGRIEVLGEEVPEDLGPEEGFESSGYLI